MAAWAAPAIGPPTAALEGGLCTAETVNGRRAAAVRGRGCPSPRNPEATVRRAHVHDVNTQVRIHMTSRAVGKLDEAPEFSRDVLDALRQPLESGEVVVARLGLTARFQARFTLVLAANPCPCAKGPASGAHCTCTPTERRRYLARLSGPLLDRVDVKVEFLPVSRAELLSDRGFTEPSSVVAKRVEAARDRAATRLRHSPWRLNAEIPGRDLRRSFAPGPGALAPLERAMDLGEISARGVDRVIRVSWTLADLAGVARPTVDQTSYALGLWLGVGGG